MTNSYTLLVETWTDAQRILVGCAIDKHIVNLGLEYAKFAEHAGISNPTLIKVRRGQEVRPKILRKVEIGCGWAPGSLNQIARGGQPTSSPSVSASASVALREPRPCLALHGTTPLRPGEVLRAWERPEGGALRYQFTRPLDHPDLAVTAPFSASTPVDQVVRIMRASMFVLMGLPSGS